jgi:hypothetical protein
LAAQGWKSVELQMIDRDAFYLWITIGGSAAAVPEPSMTVLMAMGLPIAAALGWRWKKSSP